MHVTLAYPLTVEVDGEVVVHQPDETIEVDDVKGRRLIHDGKARAAAVEDVEQDQHDTSQPDPDDGSGESDTSAKTKATRKTAPKQPKED